MKKINERRKSDANAPLLKTSPEENIEETHLHRRKKFRYRRGDGQQKKKREKIRKEEIHPEMNIYTNVNMSPFDPQVDHILSLVSFTAENDIRQTLATCNILDYKSFKQLDKKQLLNMTRNVKNPAINRCISSIVKRIEYTRFHEANGDNDLAANPTNWDEDDFFHWKINGKPKSIATFTPEQKWFEEFRKASKRRHLMASTAPTVISTEIVSNKEVVSNGNGVADDDGKASVPTTTTTTVPVGVA